MPIIDAIPSKDAATCAELLLKPMIGAALARLDFTPEQRRALEKTKQGVPLAAILGITRDERDAMLMRSGILMKSGQIAAARDLLTLLLALQPMDARTIYGLAMAYQISGDAETAGRFYLFYVGLHATNPDGHLRLGECFLSTREYDQAGECFLIATRLCARGFGSPQSREHAERMTSHLANLIRPTAN